MIIIADSNIFMSALVSPTGLTASILAERRKIQYIVPDYLLEEIEEHLSDIVTITKKTKNQIKTTFSSLLMGLTILTSENISKEVLIEADFLTKDIDEDDIPFIAFHLQYKHKIWSLDKKLINGLTAKGCAHFFISTEELRSYLYKK